MSNLPPVLYVEDEENDALLMELAFRDASLRHPLKIAADGQEAIEYLSGKGRFADREAYPLPALVILDLNLPRVPGLKVLEWIRARPEFADLPIVIYTSSDEPRDRHLARQLEASDFIVKESHFDRIIGVAQALAARWLSTMAAPQTRKKS